MGELDRDLASLICSPSLLQTFSDTDLMDALTQGLQRCTGRSV